MNDKMMKVVGPGILTLLILQLVFTFLESKTRAEEIQPSNVYNKVVSIENELTGLRQDIGRINSGLSSSIDRQTKSIEKLDESLDKFLMYLVKHDVASNK